jgi:hypothetical protein
MHFYRGSEPHTLAEKIPQLLARPQQLRQQGEAAHTTALGAHTWRHRVESILAALRPA